MNVKVIEWGDVFKRWGVNIVDDVMTKMDFLDKGGDEPWRDALNSAKADWEANGVRFEVEQEKRIAGCIARLVEEGNPFAGIVGQPGVGKTIISAGIAKVMAHYNKSNRIFFLSPGGVLKDAQSEFSKVFGGINVVDAGADGKGYFRGLEVIALNQGMAVQGRGADGIKSIAKALGWKGRLSKKCENTLEIEGVEVEAFIIDKTLILKSTDSKVERKVRLTVGGFDGWVLEKVASEPEVILTARDRTKFSFGTCASFVKTRVHKGKKVEGDAFRCPKCGLAATKKVKFKDKMTGVRKEKTVFKEFKDVKNAKTKCQHCGEPFYSAFEGKKIVTAAGGRASFSSRRVTSVGDKAERLSRKGVVFNTLIIDEAHEYRESTTLQHRNMVKLAMASQNKVAMSGTWTSGNAKDLFFLFWALMPKQMTEFGHNYHMLSEWEQQYGAKMWREVQTSEGNVTRKSKTAAGICPRIFPRFMVENFVFLKLNDMERGRKLDYKEHEINAEMPDNMREAYLEYEECIGDAIREVVNTVAAKNIIFQTKEIGRPLTDEEMKIIKMEVLSNAARTGIRQRFKWLDAPTNDVTVSMADMMGHVHSQTKTINAKLSSSFISPKEEQFVERCKKAPNGVLAFIENSGDSVVADRLIDLLEQSGVKAAFMEASVPVNARSEWMEKARDKGIKVVICNPRLVATGLNLYDFTDIVFYQPCFSIFTARQGSRRSLRLMQTKAVNVAFYSHDNSIQQQGLRMLLEGIDVARQAEGDVESYGIETGTQTNDSILKQLVKSYAGELSE